MQPRRPIKPNPLNPPAYPHVSAPVVQSRARVYLDLVEDVPGYVAIKAPFAEKDMVKAVAGRQWVAKRKQWEIPIESMPDCLRIFPTAQLSPELEEMLRTQAERIKARLEAKELVIENLVIPGINPAYSLRAYQNTGVGFLDTMELYEGMILAYDMGLGKSFTSLAYIHKAFAEGKAKYAMIVCPAALKFAVWQEELQKFFPNTEFIIIDGSRKVAVEEWDGSISKLKGADAREVQYLQYQLDTKIMVMNYELFLQDCECKRVETYIRDLKPAEIEIYKSVYDSAWNQWGPEEMQKIGEEKFHAKLHKSAEVPALQKAVGMSKWEDYCIKNEGGVLKLYSVKMEDLVPELDKDWIVVLDEAHRIKNPRAATTKNLMRKIKGAGYKVLGTGTPLENNIEELWQLVELCRPGLLGNFHQFKNRYVDLDFFGKSRGPIKERLPELKERLAPIMIRKTKEEALPDLPDLEIINRWVDMTKAQKDLYSEVKAGILQDADGAPTYLEVLAQLTRFQQVCDSPALLSEFLGKELPIASGKTIELENILGEIKPDQNKVIIFSQYKEMTKIIKDLISLWYPQHGIAYIAGGVADRKRMEEQARFQTDDTCRFMIITTAGNYGLNLQAANYVIAFDETFNPQKMNQVYSRAHRGGQTQKVTAINLKTLQTYEERKDKMLESKRGIFANVVDNRDGEVSDEEYAKNFTAEELQELY